MTLQNLRAAIFLIAEELRHVAFAVADMCQPFRAFRYSVSFRFSLESRGFLFENAVKQLLRRRRSGDRLGCLSQVERELMALGVEKIMRPAGKAIDHLRSAHFLRSPPGIQIPVAMQRNAMLFNTHVAHAHSFHELVDRHALGALQGVDNIKALGTANFRNQTLVHTAEIVGVERKCGTLHAVIFTTQA